MKSFTERPISFNSEMVRAILEGRKTQTRRVVKPQPFLDTSMKHTMFIGGTVWMKGKKFADWAHCIKNPNSMIQFSPYGQVGDRLWVRENFRYENCDWDLDHWETLVFYTVPDPSVDQLVSRQKWLPSPEVEPFGFFDGWDEPVKMPRWASRITLEITDVRVERLQDISEQDAMAEGVQLDAQEFHRWKAYGAETSVFALPRLSFRSLWNSISKKRDFCWEKNPWIWVIEFKRVK